MSAEGVLHHLGFYLTAPRQPPRSVPSPCHRSLCSSGAPHSWPPAPRQEPGATMLYARAGLAKTNRLELHGLPCPLGEHRPGRDNKRIFMRKSIIYSSTCTLTFWELCTAKALPGSLCNSYSLGLSGQGSTHPHTYMHVHGHTYTHMYLYACMHTKCLLGVC